MRFSLIALSLCLTLSAQAASYTFNQDQSSAEFEIIKFKIGAKVQGKFKKFDGTAELDEKKMELSKVNSTVQLNSVDTSEEKRDTHLKSEDFFDAGKFPTMIFASTGTMSVKTAFDMPGKLTIKGVTKDVTFKVARSETKENAYVFIASATINRLDYGVSWNKGLEQGDWKSVSGILGKAVLNDNVDIKMTIKLVPVAPAAPATTTKKK